MTIKRTYSNFEEYLLNFPPEVQQLLIKIRNTIKNAAPEAVESISYGMPAFKSHGKPLVYFAAFKNHIGFYATPSGHQEFADELSVYKQGKGSVQFPYNKPVPFDLIRRITVFRAKQNFMKSQLKKK